MKQGVIARPVQRCAIAFGALLLSLLQSQELYAQETPPPPTRRLSYEGLVARAVFTSDGIVIAVVDSTYELEYPAGSPIEWVAVRPLKWLKGNDARAHLAFWIPMYERSSMLPEGMHPEAGRAPYLIFLFRAGPAWALNASEGIWNQGAVAPPGGIEKDTHVIRAERALRGQVLDSLTMSADLVVIGTRASAPRAARLTGRAGLADAYYRVQRVVAGTTADTVLGVTAPYFIDVLGHHRRLLFLKRAPDGTYQVIKSGAGSLSLSGHFVTRLGLDLDSVVKRVQRLRRTHAPSAGAP